jgi:hypothetical protein
VLRDEDLVAHARVKFSCRRVSLIRDDTTMNNDKMDKL